MNASVLFGCGLLCTLVVSTSAVLYLRPPLHMLLIELCGNRERAGFWTAFSTVLVGSTPLIFALGYDPTTDVHTSPLIGIAAQLKWGLIGMTLSVLVLGWVIGRFIPKPPRQSASQ